MAQIYNQFMNKTRIVVVLLFYVSFLFCSTNLFGQRNAKYESYISQYKDIAIREMHRYNIPASITLAQGLLESGAGQGQLARHANNHFGIKCASGWSGATYKKDDDQRNECFRSYNSVEDSYEDHSKFLQRPHYRPLYKLKITDYKGWANGLKACGYATDKQYAAKLIRIIEEYELYRYDKVKKEVYNFMDYPQNIKTGSSKSHIIFKSGKLLYIITDNEDNLKLLSKELGISVRRLRKYNELSKNYPLKQGEIIYLQKKRRRADKTHKYHVVVPGESIHTIAQKYGIRSKYLIKRNNLDKTDYRLEAGDVLRLR